jgi:hypothetical protein
MQVMHTNGSIDQPQTYTTKSDGAFTLQYNRLSPGSTLSSDFAGYMLDTIGYPTNIQPYSVTVLDGVGTAIQPSAAKWPLTTASAAYQKQNAVRFMVIQAATATATVAPPATAQPAATNPPAAATSVPAAATNPPAAPTDAPNQPSATPEILVLPAKTGGTNFGWLWLTLAGMGLALMSGSVPLAVKLGAALRATTAKDRKLEQWLCDIRPTTRHQRRSMANQLTPRQGGREIIPAPPHPPQRAQRRPPRDPKKGAVPMPPRARPGRGERLVVRISGKQRRRPHPQGAVVTPRPTRTTTRRKSPRPAEGSGTQATAANKASQRPCRPCRLLPQLASGPCRTTN